MSDVNELVARIDGAVTSVKEKIKSQQQQELKHFQEGQKLLKEYEKVQAKVVEVVKPRLQALAKRAGERVSVTPSVSESRRSARFEFKSNKAYITLVFSVAPDREVKNAVVECDLKIVPVLWKFDSHAEFSTPVASPDLAALAKWLDDRIVGFVELYIQIHEGELYDKAEYVEDPVAKVKFPKFAAGATLDHGGQTYFFIDANTKAEFAKQKGIAAG
jgi:YHS domain-containing protein